ncbi:SrfA family protein [Serratia sp. AKBS12]|uniref:SrfA family protein n=1 Tax=Serratia sp. AKBS12 TaxID=2974597 RepID=UPI00216682FE|nr:SrfA family protein [Serratia sp. AKBS12]MCS3408652.1 SrfA family protein [Serratia sp. AKBS12]
MTKPFLRSGSLHDVVALGENGQPVYTLAHPLREALRLQNQPALAQMLAIPQVNQAGDRIDWYAPFAGAVTSWQAASPVQRQSALQALDAGRSAVVMLSQRALASANPAHRLFAALLDHVLQVPDAQYVFLLDGKPVLTFWGFNRQEGSMHDDIFACLRPVPQETAIRHTDLPQPAAMAPSPSESIPSAPATAAVVAPRMRSISRLWRWLLALAVLLALAITLALRNWPSAPAAVTVTASVAPASPGKKTVVLAPLQLPLATATVMTPAPQIAAPHDKNALVMPTVAVRAGSSRFLDGKWRARPAVDSPLTGKLPTLRYRLYHGKGTANLTQADGVRCSVKVEAGLMQSGNLVINSRTRARCSDGSRYQLPELVCTPMGDDAPAQCIGRYGDQANYPMMMTREKK